jgi:hypothetical protein
LVRAGIILSSFPHKIMPWKTLRASEVCPDHLPLPQPVCEGGDQPVTPDQVKVLHIEKVKEVVTKDSKKEFENLESWSVDVWRMYEGQVGVGGKVPSRQMMVKPGILKHKSQDCWLWDLAGVYE